MFKKDGKDYVEYIEIPARQQTIRRLTAEQFAKLQSDLEVELTRKPEEVGAEILAEKQTKLDEISAVSVKPITEEL